MRCIVIIVLTPWLLFARPSGLEVQKGNASTSLKESHLTVHVSEGAALNWKDFSIGKGESVQFVQPGKGSAVLNRVTGSDASHLLGVLQSNGAVYLINPHGVYIGGDACIQTAGFLASTADVSEEGFDLCFSNFGEGEIVNEGHISCPGGDIFLVAKSIRNEGTLSADFVGMAAGYDVLIRPEGRQRVFIRAKEGLGGVENSGTIQALAVELLSSSPYEKAISHTGAIEVLSPCEENGRVLLVAERGEVEIAGNIQASSGEIEVIGKKIVVTQSGKIDVSGVKGGRVILGGDFQAEKIFFYKGGEIW